MNERENQIVEMREDLREIFDEEYNKINLITAQNTADKMTAKGYRKVPEGAIILTKEERAALNEYQKKLDGGGDALEKE